MQINKTCCVCCRFMLNIHLFDCPQDLTRLKSFHWNWSSQISIICHCIFSKCKGWEQKIVMVRYISQITSKWTHSLACKCEKKMECLSLSLFSFVCLFLCLSENKLFLHCVVSLKLHGYPSTPLIPAQSIPSTVMLPGLKACLVKCSTSEMVCVHVSLAYQKS